MTYTQQAHEQMNRIYMTLVTQHKWKYTAYYITRVHSMQSMQQSNKTGNTHQRVESTNDYSHPILQHNLSVTYIRILDLPIHSVSHYHLAVLVSPWSTFRCTVQVFILIWSQISVFPSLHIYHGMPF